MLAHVGVLLRAETIVHRFLRPKWVVCDDRDRHRETWRHSDGAEVVLACSVFGRPVDRYWDTS